jgi:Flp pilus assembly protein TadD
VFNPVSYDNKIQNNWGILSVSRFCAVLIALVALFVSSPANAEWRKAETARFVVYGDVDTRTITEAAQELELYDSVLRFLHGVNINGVPARKLSIYLVRDSAGLRQVRPGLSGLVAGFYSATDEDIFAIAINERPDRRSVRASRIEPNKQALLHEYAHHFMLDSSAAGYPAWLVEGYAEYFSTADLDSHQIRVGLHSPERAYWLNQGPWLSLDDILTHRVSDFRTGERQIQFYAQSWLLTHWFLSRPERASMLVAYNNNMRQGMGSVPAFEVSTGMTLAAMEAEQRRYVRQPVAIKVFSADRFGTPTVEVTSLPSGESELLLLNLRLDVTLDEDDAAQALNQIRSRAARFPNTPFAQRVLARAEAKYGDDGTAEAILQALIQTDPNDAESLEGLAQIRIDKADDDGADRPTLLREARTYLARAYASNPERYQTLFALARIRTTAPSYPTDNDMATILAAYDLAPQVDSVRFLAAQARMMRGEYAEAITLLEPLASDPHGEDGAAAAQALIEQARARLDGSVSPNGAAESDPPAASGTGPA